MAIPFATAADEFRDDTDDSLTLLLVQLHRHLKLFPYLYFDRYHQHFTVMHDSGMPFNVGHPQRFVGAQLHNTFPVRDKPSLKVKLPLAFLDHLMKFPIDSCIREYRDWTTDCEDRSSPDEHFVWLSNEFTPFQTDPGTPHVPPDFTLGLPDVGDWPKQTREVPWVLDPAEHPRLAIQSHHESTSPSSGDERWKRRKKKHRRPKKQELKVTTWGKGDNIPIWTHTGSNLSSSSESQTEGDSGIGSSYRKPPGGAGSTTRHDHTSRYSPETVRKIDRGDLKDAPLSDHGGDQEMVSKDEGVKEVTGTNPIWPTGPAATPEGSEVLLLADPADTDDEKAHWDTFQLIMQGFHATTHTLSNRYQQACKEVQNIVRRSMKKSTVMDRTFVWRASAAIRQWVWAVQPAIDCMEESLEEQAHLLQAAWQAGKGATEDILALLPVEDSPYLTLVMPKEDLLTPALQVTWTHTQKAIEAINVQLLALAHQHVPPQQAGVFLACLLQVMCSYQQEMDGMATSQVILPGQIVPNLWGVSQTMMEGLTLLGPPNCPASWPASLVEQVSAEPIKKATPAGLTTLVKHDTSVPKGKLHPGLSSKKSAPPKQITEYWDDNERKKEDEESCQREEEKHKKKPSGPMLSLDEHEELVTLLTSKAAPGQVSQGSGLPPHTQSEGKWSRSKVWRASPVRFNSLEDEPLSDKTGEPEPKSRKKDQTTPELMIMDDDDEPLPERPKGMGKKDKSHAYIQDELASLDSLLLWLKSEARSIQYTMETAGLTKYCNYHVPGLK